MIKTITIENFMSHRATRLELAPGVTVITGPNNIGKSAVVEGVRSLVHNPSPKHSIRHGARQALVRLELDSGEIIEWVRSEKTAYYRLVRPAGDGREEAPEVEEYRKLGQSVPQDIMALLRLGRVETESGDLDIHIGNQREPIFLLNSPGSHAASFFAASTEAEYLLRMRQALKSRVDFAKAATKALAGECQSLERDLLRFAPLDDLGSEMERAEKSHELLRQNHQALPELARLLEILGIQEELVLRQRQSAHLLAAVQPPPGLHEVAGLEAWLKEWHKRAAQRNLAAGQSRVLAPLNDPPALQDADHLAHLAGRLAEADGLLARRRQEQTILRGLNEAAALQPVADLEDRTRTLQRLESALAANRDLGGVLEDLQGPPRLEDLTPLERLADALSAGEPRVHLARRRQAHLARLALPPEAPEVAPLLQHIGEISRTQAGLHSFEALAAVLAGLAALPEAAPTRPLEDLIDALAGIGRHLSQKEQERQALEQALGQTRLGLEKLIQETGLCPLCGSPMDLTHFLEATHA